MDAQTIVDLLLANPSALETMAAPFPNDVALDVVERLKQEADRHWWINANRSLELANLIVAIGQRQGNVRQIALGTMARGDALKYLGQFEAAWSVLDQAGELFRAAGDEVGWARTRIGRLFICTDLQRVDEAMREAEQARAIFLRHQEYEKLLRLDYNTGLILHYLGDQQQALALYRSALAIAESLGEAGQSFVGGLYTNIGNVYDLLGDFHEALAYYERAQEIFMARSEPRGVVVTEINMARIAMAQGHYRHALQLLHHVHDLKAAEQLALDTAQINRIIVECYLSLNRYDEARHLAQQVISEARRHGAAREEALALLHLATAEAELANLEAAHTALDAAEPIWVALGMTTWLTTTRLRRGRIALRQGNATLAEQEALAAADYFASSGEQVNYATAILMQGQALFARGALDEAVQAGQTTLHIAQRCNVPALRYGAHLLLGQIAEAQEQRKRATRRYLAAISTVERVQRGLTITLRPGFLEDKGDALRALIGLHLQARQHRQAFEVLERAKSQVLLNYLANREQLRWTDADVRNRALIDELNRLRAEHQWFYRIAHEQTADGERPPGSYHPQQALAEVVARERRMRAITEQLYLNSGDNNTVRRVTPPTLPEIQHSLADDGMLIEFYNDGSHLWAFTIDSTSMEVHHLPITVDNLDRLLMQWQSNLAFALKAGPEAPVLRSLTSVGQRLLQQLYAALLQPLAERVAGRQRLVMVPYGALHYLPFHLLHSGSQYLIEQYEVVILPAAGLATHRSPTRASGARVLAHSWEGRLPQTQAEAQVVQRLFGGTIYAENAAQRTVLQTRPTQVLHIAAHGEHRLDQPDLSYIQLADGQVWTDDLWQHDLSYELVTLSACETGRANIAAGDELIGLGRGFLYAGAGALITSLWRVADASSLVLMEHIYTALCTGVSKAAALRSAQCAMLAERPALHPAFWGVFQLIGDAHPLSKGADNMLRKEYIDATLSGASTWSETNPEVSDWPALANVIAAGAR